MFPWWRDWSCNFHLFQKHWDMETLQAHFLLWPPTDFHTPIRQVSSRQPNLPSLWCSRAPGAILGCFYSLWNTPQAKSFWEKCSNLCSRKDVFRGPFASLFCLKDCWRPVKLSSQCYFIGYFSLLLGFHTYLQNHWCVNPAKNLSPQFGLEPWPIITWSFY